MTLNDMTQFIQTLGTLVTVLTFAWRATKRTIAAWQHPATQSWLDRHEPWLVSVLGWTAISCGLEALQRTVEVALAYT